MELMNVKSNETQQQSDSLRLLEAEVQKGRGDLRQSRDRLKIMMDEEIIINR